MDDDQAFASQTAPHVGPGSYLEHKVWCPPKKDEKVPPAPFSKDNNGSHAVFGSRKHRFKYNIDEPRLELKAETPEDMHRRIADQELAEGRQAEFEMNRLKDLRTWLSKHRMNLRDTVTFTLTLQNVNFKLLCEEKDNEDLKSNVEDVLKHRLADAAGGRSKSIRMEHLKLKFSKPSPIGWTVLVEITIQPPRGVHVKQVEASILAASSLSQHVNEDLKGLEGIDLVSMGNMSIAGPPRVGRISSTKVVPVKTGCNKLMQGDSAKLDNCTDCGKRHFWYCCNCGIAQYAGVGDEDVTYEARQCVNGCEKGKIGWVCINSACRDNTTVESAFAVCGCWRYATNRIPPHWSNVEIPPRGSSYA